MSLTDQQRTETAADNCEVLRARLAKYEDAEGLPVGLTHDQAELVRLVRDLALRAGKHARPLIHAAALGLESQAREIERLNYRYQREVYGLNNEGDPIGGDPAGGYANDNARLRKELAALKAQPVGVVLPDRVAMAKALCKHHAEQCGVNADDQWKVYSENFFEDVDVMLAATPSAGSQKEQK